MYETSTGEKKRRWFFPLLLVLVILAGAAGFALSRLVIDDARAVDAADTTASTEVSTAPEAAPSDEPAPGAQPRSEPKSEPKSQTKPASRKPSAKPSTAPAGPSILYFQVAQKPSCPSGTDQVRTEGQPVVLEWKTTGATGTELAVDGPGKYADYGPEGSVTLNFPCSGEPGSYQTHTYTLTAIGETGTKTRKLTVRAKVNEIAST